MLELSIVRWAAGGPHNYAGIRVDGVGNRNIPGAQPGGSGTGLYGPLPPTPEYRVNTSLRWFRGSPQRPTQCALARFDHRRQCSVGRGHR